MPEQQASRGNKGKRETKRTFQRFSQKRISSNQKNCQEQTPGAFQFCLENWKHGSNRSFVHWCKFTQKPSNLPKNEKSVNFQFYKVEPIGTLMNKNFIPSVFLFYKPHLISQRILNSKSQWIIYLLEYILCNIQHIGKSETSFNIRLNNHRKDVSNPKAIPVCAQFRTE